jgi:hypothetical protein
MKGIQATFITACNRAWVCRRRKREGTQLSRRQALLRAGRRKDVVKESKQDKRVLWMSRESKLVNPWLIFVSGMNMGPHHQQQYYTEEEGDSEHQQRPKLFKPPPQHPQGPAGLHMLPHQGQGGHPGLGQGQGGVQQGQGQGGQGQGGQGVQGGQGGQGQVGSFWNF